MVIDITTKAKQSFGALLSTKHKQTVFDINAYFMKYLLNWPESRKLGCFNQNVD